MGRVLRFIFFALAAVFLLQLCFPGDNAPSEKGLEFVADSFEVASQPEETVVLENDHIWSLWTARGASCLEVKLKAFTGDLESRDDIHPEDWLAVLKTVPALPPSPGAIAQPMHHGRRGGMRVFGEQKRLGVALDSIDWTLEKKPSASRQSVVFVLDIEGAVLRKEVFLEREGYAFQVGLSASGEGPHSGNTLHLRVATGGGIQKVKDAFYRNPFTAAPLMEHGEVDSMEIFNQIPYIIEGSKYFLSVIRPLDQSFRSAVTEVLFDEEDRREKVLGGLSPEEITRMLAVARAQADLNQSLGRPPSSEEVAAEAGVTRKDALKIWGDYRDRSNKTGKKSWLKASVAGDFPLYVAGPREKAEARSFQWFVGPKDPAVLEDMRYGDLGEIPGLVDYETSFFYRMFFTGAVAPFILSVLSFLHGIFGNWGWAIVVMTLLLRMVLFPVTRHSQLKMAEHGARTAKVKPQLDRISKEFADDPKRRQEETMKLYRENKITPPLGGCLPILLQFPVFVGLFAALRSSIILRQEPWMGWVTDLSRPDALIDFGGPVADLPLLSSMTSFNLLPLVMVVLWVFHQKSMPKPTDPQQAQMHKMMTWMPIMFGVLLYNYAAGLSLYMITSSGLGIIETRFVRKHWPVQTPSTGGAA